MNEHFKLKPESECPHSRKRLVSYAKLFNQEIGRKGQFVWQIKRHDVTIWK
jgi:hypothetical protein